MGRSNNSFKSYVGHARETLNEDKVTLPEKDLWVAVLCRAVLDACKGPPMLNMDLKSNRTHKNAYTYDRDQARHFFIEGGYHFQLICEMAGRNPEYVQQKETFNWKFLLCSKSWKRNEKKKNLLSAYGRQRWKTEDL